MYTHVCVTRMYTHVCVTRMYTRVCVTRMYTHMCMTRMYTHVCVTRMYTLTIHPYIFHIKLNVCTHTRVYSLQAYNLYDTQCMHIACVIQHTYILNVT